MVNLTIKYITWSCLYVITNTPSQRIYDVLHAQEDVTFLCPKDLSLDLFPRNATIHPGNFWWPYVGQKNQTFPSLIFSQRRHKKVYAIYISQKFTGTNLVIRQKANILVMFNIDKKSREGVHDKYA